MAKHTYIIVRHGISLANQSKKIVSTLTNGVKPEYGLADEGKQQTQKCAEELRQHLLTGDGGATEAGKPILVVSSPFSRAVQTADIFLKVLAGDESAESSKTEITTTPKDGKETKSAASAVSLKGRILNKDLKPDIAYELCERNFGELELTSDSNYHSVWDEDKTSEHSNSRGVEPVAAVWARVSVLLNKLEMSLPKPSVIILVSHGDTLQITQTAFASEPLGQHRSQKHLVQSEWRVLCNEARKKSQKTFGFKSKPEISKL